MIKLNCEQYSEEWFAAHIGIPTASKFDQIVTTKGEPSKQAEKYLYRLAGERIIGKKTDTYTNAMMERGLLLEEEARELFQFITDMEVETVGLCYPNKKKQYACSPDGLTDGAGLEIKCPDIHTHVSYLLKKELPLDYFQQVQGSMFVTKLPQWYFMSYYPGLPPLIILNEQNKTFTKILKNNLAQFCERLDEITARLREMQ